MLRYFVASDEFQCLDEKLDATPFKNWFGTGQIKKLSLVRRTRQQGLLDAAMALRAGGAPTTKAAGLSIAYKFPNQVKYAVGHELHRAIRAGGQTAVIVGPAGASWANGIVSQLQIGLRSSSQVVPALRIGWETRSDAEATIVLSEFERNEELDCQEIVLRLSNIKAAPPWVGSVTVAVQYQEHACGVRVWTANRVRELIERKSAVYRAFGGSRNSGIPVMSIHGAKNRQFSNVVVLWPYGVKGSDDYQRRLLYNAITRAEDRCIVFVQGAPLLQSAPFA